MDQNTDQIVVLATRYINAQNAILDPIYEELCKALQSDPTIALLGDIEGWACDLINCKSEEEVRLTLVRMRNTCGRLHKNIKKNIIVDSGVPYAQGSGRIGKQYLQEKFRELSENMGEPIPNAIGPASSNEKAEYLDKK